MRVIAASSDGLLPDMVQAAAASACATWRSPSPALKPSSSNSQGGTCVNNERGNQGTGNRGRRPWRRNLLQVLPRSVSARSARALPRVHSFCTPRRHAAAALPLRLHLHSASHGQRKPHGRAGGVDFGTILLPGLMAVAIMFSGIAAVALPLSFRVRHHPRDRRPRHVPAAPLGRRS